VVVIGIAGGTASGKSTITRKLIESFHGRALRIAHDRYYRTLPERYRANPLDYNFDHPDALDTERLVADLHRLRTGQEAVLVDYDYGICERRDPSTWEVVSPPEILVIEGILVLAVPELRQLFDHSVFVHTAADLRLARRLRRDIVERGDTPNGVIDQYLATVRPMHLEFVEPSRVHADLVIDGTGQVEHAISRIRTLVGE